MKKKNEKKEEMSMNIFRRTNVVNMKKLLILIVIIGALFLCSCGDKTTAPKIPQLQFTLINNGTAYEVSRGTMNSDTVIIPSTYNNLPVIKIADSGFMNFNSMTIISLPNSIMYIGTLAFAGCTNLTTIAMPDGVQSIDASAFSNCTNLRFINIPINVTSVGANAFLGCTNLTIYVDATSRPAGWHTNWNPDNRTVYWDVAFGTEGLQFNRNGAEYHVSGGTVNSAHVMIPPVHNGLPVIGIAMNGFRNFTNMTSVIIPSSVTRIAQSAFQDCTGLTSIIIPNSVTVIGPGAFSGCTGLTSINVESGNAIYRSQGNCVIRISDNELVVGIKTSVIPFGVTVIGHAAFARHTGLTSITIPNSVTYIGLGAFTGCTGLTSIIIPNSVTSIGPWAFEGCTGLTSITIHNSVTFIGWYAFSGCTGLTFIHIPNSVTVIGGEAFFGCTGLTFIYIPTA